MVGHDVKVAGEKVLGYGTTQLRGEPGPTSNTSILFMFRNVEGHFQVQVGKVAMIVDGRLSFSPGLVLGHSKHIKQYLRDTHRYTPILHMGTQLKRNNS